jgi:capsule biosynthesis phosphatase
MKRIIVDLDNTICFSKGDYKTALPNKPIIKQLDLYKSMGFEIVISTSRNMRTFCNNIGKINIHTLPGIINWLESHNVAYDEVIVGKPWCGHEGFYVDDKSIRPDEFAQLTYEEILKLINN